MTRAVVIARAMLVACLCAGAARGQFDPRDMTLSEVKTHAGLHVNSRAWEEALPHIEELVLRLEFTEEEAAWKILEWAMFQRGVAQMETDRLQAAITSFKQYIKRWPKGIYLRHAYLLQGECFASLEKWDDVRQVMAVFLRIPTLRNRDRVWGSQLVGESYFREKKWRESVKPLAYVVENAARRDARTLAAVQVTTALVKIEDFEALFTFLPYVYRTSARYDIDLNLALIEAGDRNYGSDRYVYAIALYRLIHFKPELVRNLERRIAEVERRSVTIWREEGLDFAQKSRLVRSLKRQIRDYKGQEKELREVPDYDQEVIIRMAQTYLNLERYWEALIQFRRVFDVYPDHELAEQGLYSAYATALEMGLEERALKEGYDYLEAFPGGEYWESLTVSLGQLHVKRTEYAECIALAESALDLKPEHRLRPNLLYLMGYSHFNLNQHEQALARFGAILADHPESAFVEDASYWHPMTYLFLQQYTPSREEFAHFLQTYPESHYLEDASFRYAVGLYGEGDYSASHEQLSTFLTAYPESRLAGEAYCMLGDITASWTQLDKALAHYAKVPDVAANMTEINYAAFQAARVYELEQRFDGIIDLFRDYLRRYDQDGNVSQALYWIGNAYMKSDRPDEAFDTFFSGFTRYGNDPKRYGIDMIIRDLVVEHDALKTLDAHIRFMKKLYRALGKARKTDERTLNLRLVTLFAEVTEPGADRDRLIAVLMNPRNIEAASPLTLTVMGREAAARGKEDLTREAHRALLERFGDSDFTLDALSGLADVEISAGRFEEAEALLAELIRRYPRQPAAGAAQKRLGDIARLQGHNESAILAYNTLLSVREWRGPLFPEALYWIGVCHLDAGNPREAFAHFQRIYLLYSAHREWSARGYLKSAECLLELNQKPDAISTLEEMLADESLRDLPEFGAARETLEKLGGQA